MCSSLSSHFPSHMVCSSVTSCGSLQSFLVYKNLLLAKTKYNKCIQTENRMQLMLRVVSMHDSSIFHHFTIALLIVQLGPL